jgi:predicted DNA-binding transcriptional regulator AlpA
MIQQAEPMMTTRAVMNRLSVARATIDRLVDRGILPKPARVGGVNRWERAEVEAAIAAMKQ